MIDVDLIAEAAASQRVKRCIELQKNCPELVDVIIGTTIMMVGEIGADTIENIHEMVQFQKILNQAIDNNPWFVHKDFAKRRLEQKLYKKED